MFFSTRIVTFIAAFLGFWILYRVHALASRDPTSVFFNPRLGYTPRYSAIRRHQAEDFIAAANTSSYDATFQKAHPNHRKICVGIPSMARKGARYLRDTVGSLLEGLTLEERREIYLTVFIPHSDPTVHPAYNEAWLPALADDVITYDVGEEGMKKVKVMEAEAGEYLEKGLYDYRYLLKHCGKQQTPYIAIFEDDIVAMDGWYHRTMAGIEEAEKKSALQHESSEFLYLRLFHTEEFLGWNSEDWRTYLFYSVIFFSVPMVVLFYFRLRNSTGKNIVTNRFLLIGASLITASIGLFFAFGRVTVLPPPSGIHLMPKYGCCSQGHVFPRGRALMLTTFFADRHLGAPDVLIEDYANERGELRWAITPSVIQHVGRKSSKMDDYGPNSKHGLSVAEKIWNFAFERYDPVALRKEHERVAKKASRS